MRRNKKAFFSDQCKKKKKRKTIEWERLEISSRKLGQKLVQPLWRTVWRFLKKLEIELPYDPAIPLLGIHAEETRTKRDTCTPMFIAV